MAERFIAVAGNIGVGKSSIVEWLATHYGLEPVYEPFAENPYLDDFYADMSQWGFHSQVWFLAHKYRLHREVMAQPGTRVQDRTIYEDAEIFATYLYKSGSMSQRDYATYMELYEAMRMSLASPDLMIYLRCSVRAIRRRIKKRARPAEQGIPAEYLRNLNHLYEDWIGRWDACPVIVWDSERLDYLSDLVHQIEFRRAMAPFLAGE